MTYEEWKEDYGLVYEPNYCLGTEADCRAAFIAGAASRDAEIATLKAELRAISVALDDPRTDLTMTMVEVIAELREQVKMLRALCTEGANGFGRILISTSDNVAVRDWQKRANAAIAKVRKS